VGVARDAWRLLEVNSALPEKVVRTHMLLAWFTVNKAGMYSMLRLEWRQVLGLGWVNAARSIVVELGVEVT